MLSVLRLPDELRLRVIVFSYCLAHILFCGRIAAMVSERRMFQQGPKSVCTQTGALVPNVATFPHLHAHVPYRYQAGYCTDSEGSV